MTDILIAPPTVEPLSRQQAKDHLRVTTSDEDALIDGLIVAARSHVEGYLGAALVLQSRRLLLDGFPAYIDLEHGPVRAVQSIQYLDEAGELQTLAADQYRLDKYSRPARITPEYDVTWPATRPVTNAVIVNYTAGHLVPFVADAGTDVLTAAGHGFANADISQVETIGGTLPTALAASTNYHVRDAAADTLKVSASAGGAAVDITGAGIAPNVLGYLPREIRHAMLLLIGHWYVNRESVVTGTISAVLEQTVDALLSPHKFQRF